MSDELFQPYNRLIDIEISEKKYRVPDSNSLLRCFQYLCLEDVSAGRFCWNQECKTCALAYETREGKRDHGLACQTEVEERMKIVKISKELRWALRSILTRVGR